MSQEVSDLEACDGTVDLFGLRESIRLWRDKYVSLIEREMVLGFSLLEKKLLELLQKNLKLILTGRASKFRFTVLQPAVQEWFDVVVLPVLDDANREFECILSEHDNVAVHDFDVSLTRVLAGPLAVSAGGIGVCVAGAYFGIGSKTAWLIVPYMGITNPVLLIGAVVLGSILFITGVVKLASVRERIAKLFAKSFMPKLRESLIGTGYEQKGVKHNSLRRKLQSSIEERAQQLICEIERKGSRGNDTV